MNAAEGEKVARWGIPSGALSLIEDEVHVWRATLKVVNRDLEEMTAILSAAEREEVEGAADRKPLVGRLHMARSLLARYLDRDPARLRLTRQPDGRLVLAGRGAPHFDVVSHDRRALFAISATRRVAVAVAALSEDEADVDARLRRLPPREARQLAFLSPRNRAHAVAGREVEDAALARLEAAGAPPDGRVDRLKFGGGYTAALAAEGWDWSASLWRYQRPPRQDGDGSGG